jgi:hypothetical protein
MQNLFFFRRYRLNHMQRSAKYRPEAVADHSAHRP